jgi:hypothetical protein
MALTEADVLISEARVLYSPVGTAKPDETTVAYDAYGSWTGWTELGYTLEPLTVAYGYDTAGVDVQQSTLPIKRRKISETMTITTTLGQLSGDNLALVLNGTNTDTAAGASQKAFSSVAFGGDTNLPEWQFAFEGYRPDSAGTKQPVRLFVHKANIAAAGDIPFDKANASGIPIEVMALEDSTQSAGERLGVMHIVTAPASS